MGKNVNALLVIVYEYYRVTTAQENQQNVVLYLFYVFFSTSHVHVAFSLF